MTLQESIQRLLSTQEQSLVIMSLVVLPPPLAMDAQNAL